MHLSLNLGLGKIKKTRFLNRCKFYPLKKNHPSRNPQFANLTHVAWLIHPWPQDLGLEEVGVKTDPKSGKAAGGWVRGKGGVQEMSGC